MERQFISTNQTNGKIKSLAVLLGFESGTAFAYLCTNRVRDKHSHCGPSNWQLESFQTQYRATYRTPRMRSTIPLARSQSFIIRSSGSISGSLLIDVCRLRCQLHLVHSPFLKSIYVHRQIGYPN